MKKFISNKFSKGLNTVSKTTTTKSTNSRIFARRNGLYVIYVLAHMLFEIPCTHTHTNKMYEFDIKSKMVSINRHDSLNSHLPSTLCSIDLSIIEVQ